VFTKIVDEAGLDFDEHALMPHYLASRTIAEKRMVGASVA
jgi:hypothetical protein